MASFAGILDGRSLWVAVPATPGSLALRDSARADVIALTNDAPDDQPAYTSIRVDLSDLPDLPADQDLPARYDVVLVPSGGRAARAVWSPPLPATRVAPDVDHGTQWGLARSEEGTLQVTREPLAPAAWLSGVTETPEGIRVTARYAAAETETPLLALVVDGEPVVTFPTSYDATSVTGVLTAEPSLGADLDLQARVVVGTPGSWTPVRRRHDDLPDPGRGAPLPPVTVAGTETPRIRLRFGGEAYLVARILPLEAPETPQTPEAPHR